MIDRDDLVPQLVGSAPPNALGALAMPQLLWHRTRWQRTSMPSPARTIRIPFVRLVRFSFLILIGRFVTLEGMKIKSVTPMHHPMSMGSSANCRPPSRYRA
jgi:hypothetical protein